MMEAARGCPMRQGELFKKALKHLSGCRTGLMKKLKSEIRHPKNWWILQKKKKAYINEVYSCEKATYFFL